MRVRGSTKTIPLLIALSAALGCATSPAAELGSAPQISFFASNLLMRTHGVFHEWAITEAHVDPDDLANSFVRVEVDLASVDTGIEARDEHLRTADFFDVETYPKARVRVHSPEKIGTDEDGDDRYRALFDVDLHGIQKTLPGEFFVRGGEPTVIEGDLVLDRLDFGIGGPSSFSETLWVIEKIPVSFRVELPP